MDDQIQVTENPDKGKQLYKSGIEALLFVSDKPIVLDQFKTVFPELKPAEIVELIKQLQDEYVQRQAGMMIVDIAGGWQMLSNSHAAGYIREFYKTKSKEKLSRPSLESLAIIAYKQPVSRADLEVIRGVNCDGTVAHLLNKGLIEIVGRKEVPGRPFLYGTTKAFLEYFGLRALEDLPKLEQLPQVSQIDAAPSVTEAPLQAQEAVDIATVESTTQETSGQSRLLQEVAVEEKVMQEALAQETTGQEQP